MKLSNYYLPTLREEPAEAVTLAHRLMARSAMVRMSGVGVFNLLPYGVEMAEKVRRIVEERIFGEALKVSTSRLQGRAMWEASGRWERYGSNMYKVVDRYNRQAALAPESEEAFLSLIAGELKSYKQLPLFLYENEKRFKDVQKPKLGFADAREVELLDGYRFDASLEEGEAFLKDIVAKMKSLLDEWGIDYRVVEDDEVIVFYGIGDGYGEALACCGDETYPTSLAPVAYPALDREEPQKAEDIHTPGAATIKDLSDMIGVEPAHCTKAVDLNVGGEPVFVFVPGDRDLNLKKLANYLKVDEESIDMLDEDTIGEMGSFPGFTGPVGLSDKARIIVDKAVTTIDNMVVGANRLDYHKKNVNYGRDFEAEVAEDLLTVHEGDRSPCGGTYDFVMGFELLRLKKPSTHFAEAMNIQFISEAGRECPYVLTGVEARVESILSAIVEAHCDEEGLNLPIGIAPYDVVITVVNVKKEEQIKGGLSLYDALREKGIAALLDDRSERAGVKFKDRDLIGIPLQVTAGKDIAEGLYECKCRSGEVQKLSIEDVIAFIEDALSH